MSEAPTYLHAIDGRIRIKIPAIKGAPLQASELENQLRQQSEHIHHVTANSVTGSVLILYHAGKAQQAEMLDTLRELGYLRQHGNTLQAAGRTRPTSPGFGQELVRTVLNSTMEFALQRLIVALI